MPAPLSDVATTLIDVAVTSADAPSMVARSAVLNSSNVLGSAAAFKEETKRTGYVGVYDAVKSGAQLFVPFVIESSGFIGLEASNFLKSVAAEAVSNGTESSENVCRARLASEGRFYGAPPWQRDLVGGAPTSVGYGA